jgi:hypothetical protein
VRGQALLRRLPLEGLVYIPLDTLPLQLFASICRCLAVGAFSLHEKDSSRLSVSQLKHVMKQLPLIRQRRPEFIMPYLRLLQSLLITWSPDVLDICKDVQVIPWLVNMILESLEVAGSGKESDARDESATDQTDGFVSSSISEEAHQAVVCLCLFIIARQRSGEEDGMRSTASLLIMLLKDTPLIPYIYRYFVRVSSHRRGCLSRQRRVLRSWAVLWQLWVVCMCSVQRAVAPESPLDSELLQVLLQVGLEKLLLRLFQSMSVIANLPIAVTEEGSGDCESVSIGKREKWNNLLLLLKLCRQTLLSLCSVKKNQVERASKVTEEKCHCSSDQAVSTCSLHTTSQLVSRHQSICVAEVWLLRVHECASLGVQWWILSCDSSDIENNSCDSYDYELTSPGTIPLFSRENDITNVDDFFKDFSRRCASLRSGRCVGSGNSISRWGCGAPQWCRHLRLDMALGCLLQQSLGRAQEFNNQAVNLGVPNLHGLDAVEESILLGMCFCSSSQVEGGSHSSSLELFNCRYLFDTVHSWVEKVNDENIAVRLVLHVYISCITRNINDNVGFVMSGVLLSHWVELVCDMICYTRSGDGFTLSAAWATALQSMLVVLTESSRRKDFDWLFVGSSEVTVLLIHFYAKLLKHLVTKGEKVSTLFCSLLRQISTTVQVLAKVYLPAKVFWALTELLELASDISIDDKSPLPDLHRHRILPWIYSVLLQPNDTLDSTLSGQYREYFSSPAWASVVLSDNGCLTAEDVGRSVAVTSGLIFSDIPKHNDSSQERSQAEKCTYWGDSEGFTLSVWFALATSLPLKQSDVPDSPHLHYTLFSLNGEKCSEVAGSVPCRRPDIAVFCCNGRICVVVGGTDETCCVQSGSGQCIVFDDLPSVQSTNCHLPTFHHLAIRYTFASGRIVAYLDGGVSSEQRISYPSYNEDVSSGQYSVSTGISVASAETTHTYSSVFPSVVPENAVLESNRTVCDHELQLGPLLVFHEPLHSSQVSMLYAAGPGYDDAFTNSATSNLPANTSKNMDSNVSTALEKSSTDGSRDQGSELQLDIRYCSPILVDNAISSNVRLQTPHQSGFPDMTFIVPTESLSPSLLLMGITKRHTTAQRLPPCQLGARSTPYIPPIPTQFTVEVNNFPDFYSPAMVEASQNLNATIYSQIRRQVNYHCGSVDTVCAVRGVKRPHGCAEFQYEYSSLTSCYSVSDGLGDRVLFYNQDSEDSVEKSVSRASSWLNLAGILLHVLFAAHSAQECQQVLRLVRCMWQIPGIGQSKGYQAFVFALMETLREKMSTMKGSTNDIRGKSISSAESKNMCNSPDVVVEMVLLSSVVLCSMRPSFRMKHNAVLPTIPLSQSCLDSLPVIAAKEECFLYDTVLLKMIMRDCLLTPTISALSYTQLIQGILDTLFDSNSRYTPVNKKQFESSAVFQTLLCSLCHIHATEEKLLILFGVFFQELLRRDFLSKKDYFYLFHMGCVLSSNSKSTMRRVRQACQDSYVAKRGLEHAMKLGDVKRHIRFVRQCVLTFIQHVRDLLFEINIHI